MDCLLVFMWALTVVLGFLAGILYGYNVGRNERPPNGGGSTGNGEGERHPGSVAAL